MSAHRTKLIDFVDQIVTKIVYKQRNGVLSASLSSVFLMARLSNVQDLTSIIECVPWHLEEGGSGSNTSKNVRL